MCQVCSNWPEEEIDVYTLITSHGVGCGPSFVCGQMVLEKKMIMWKVYDNKNFMIRKAHLSPQGQVS